MAGKRLEEKADMNRDLSFWLVTLAWGTGAFVYGWLLAGVFEKRVYWDKNYWKESYEILGFWNFCFPLFCGIIAAVISFFLARSKKSTEGKSRQLLRIVVAVLPALFLVSALAVLTLTLATYNGDWMDARQGIATAFAALIAAVGVVVSVAVSYKTGEENRLLQKQTEQQKLDAELIKSLNDRLHEIIARRYGDKPHEVSASYFQLAALYRDWETLADNSELVKSQKGSQQRNILKLLFGVYLESDEKNTSGEKNSSDRSEVDIRTLNSVIQDIFPLFEEGADNESAGAQKEETESKTPDGQQGTFDLSYLDLRGLDLSRRDLRGANLIGARLAGAYSWRAHLERANLEDAELERANLIGAHLEGASLWGAHLERVNLEDADLAGADLVAADLAGANLIRARLEGADLEGAYLDNASFFIELLENPEDLEVRSRIIEQLKTARFLPEEDELLKAKGFAPDLVNQIIQAHKEEQAGKEE